MIKSLRLMKIICVFLIICLCVPAAVTADDDNEKIFHYKIENGYAVITRFVSNDVSKVLIPSVIGGYEVREIGSNAFEMCHNLTEVVCPSTLKKIGGAAFRYCSNLEKLYLNEGLEDIEQSAISYCDKLSEVVFPSTVENVPLSVEYCDAVETIVFEGFLTKPQIFVADCPNLKKVVFKEDINKIDSSAEYFKYNFYEALPRAKKVNPRYYTKPLNVVISGKAGSNIEKFAKENGFEFLPTQGEESEYIISEWAEDEVRKAVKLGFVPVDVRGNYKKYITRGEFAKMAMYFLAVQYGYQPEYIIKTNSDNGDFSVDDFVSAYCASKKDRNENDFINADTDSPWKYEDKNTADPLKMFGKSPFTDTEESRSKELIGCAYNFGIISGIDDNTFNPDGDITRQEAAALLMRIYKNYALYQIANTDYEFSDDYNISEWAKEDVYAVNSLKIMQGTGDDRFSPMEKYTTEQAAAAFLRLYESAPTSRKNKNITPLLDWKYAKEDFDNNASFVKKDDYDFEDYLVTVALKKDGGDKIYVFYKYGGMRDLLSLTNVKNSEPAEEVNINDAENKISFAVNISDDFILYNDLAKKAYDAGKYKYEIDLITGDIISLLKL